MDLDLLAVVLQDAVGDVRRGLHQVHVLFAFEPLLDDLHVQQAEEAAAEAEAERIGGLRLEVNDESLSRSFSSALRSVSKSPVLVGKKPQNTIGLGCLKPGSGSAASGAASLCA